MIHSSARVDESATVSHDAHIGAGTSIWHLAQVREDAAIGQECVIGRGAYIGSGVRIGDRCKIQNYALVYEPAVVGCSSARALSSPMIHTPERSTPTALQRLQTTGARSESSSAPGHRSVLEQPV